MAKHPDVDLVPYLRGELAPAERERVARHLEECQDCRQDTEQLRDLLGDVARSIGQPPAINWASYRAELREKIEARRGQPAWWWWRRPVPLALSAGLAGVLLLVSVWGGRQLLTAPDPLTLDEAVLGEQLPLLQQYQLVERLDLLEDLDVIRNLDGLAADHQG